LRMTDEKENSHFQPPIQANVIPQEVLREIKFVQIQALMARQLSNTQWSRQLHAGLC
jgi:hypothetical protein